MASGHILLPTMPARDLNGRVVSGARLFFFENNTSAPKAVYSDAGLTTAHAQPVVADSAGSFPQIFADDAEAYSVTCFAPDGTQLPHGAFDNVRATVSAAITAAIKSAEAVRGMASALGIPFYDSRSDAEAAVDDLEEGVAVGIIEDEDHSDAVTINRVEDGEIVYKTTFAGSGGGGGGGGTGYFNVADYGAIGDGVVDDTAAIQAAIDACYLAEGGAIFLGDGVFKISGPLYLGNKADLIADLANPAVFNFSMRLMGTGLGNSEGFGSTLRPTDNSFKTVIVGPGQHMSCYDFAVRPVSITFPSDGAGIYLCGGPGGLSKAHIKGVKVEFYNKGFQGGGNNGSLCDSVLIEKCDAVYCWRAYSADATQNYAWTLLDCHASYCIESVASDVGRPINVFGGNFSAPGFTPETFAISSVGTFSDHVYDGAHTFQFNTTIAETNVNFRNQLATGRYYRAAGINTTDFGEVPLDLVSFNTTTGVARWEVNRYWVAQWYGPTDIRADTLIATQIAAATTIDLGILVVTFKGAGMRVNGYHLENPNSVTCLAWSAASFGGPIGMFIEGGFHNWAEDASDYIGQPVHRLQGVTPFLLADVRSVSVRDTAWRGSTALVFRALGVCDLTVLGPVFGGGDGVRLISPTVETGKAGTASFPSDTEYTSIVSAKGKFDPSPFVPFAYFGGGNVLSRDIIGTLRPNPYWGYAPSKAVRGSLSAAELALLSTTISAGFGTYRLPYGGRLYDIPDAASSGDPVIVRADHVAFTYGQDITGNWSYRGKSHILKVSTSAALQKLFPGLIILIDNGSDPEMTLVVRGVNTDLGWVYVANYGGSQLGMDGSKNTVFTGSVIGQQPMAFTTIAEMP